jgi:hypothetical protein
LRLSIALFIGALVLTSTSLRRRQITREWSENAESVDRYVDIGVDLHVVRADPKGKPLIDGCRPMIELREPYQFGGIVDTKAEPPRIVDISEKPQQWFCSEDQEQIILHPDDAPVGKLAKGGMGAGKTTAGVIWTYLRWLENLGTLDEMGITAPTETRLSLVFNEMFKMFPRNWWRYNSESKILTLCDEFRVRGVSTHRQSASQGSRLQAFNWVALLADELQDSIDEFVHMMARLRSKRDGRAKRLATVTAKDDPAFRALEAQMLESGIWQLHTLLGPSSPFINPEHWDNMKRLMTQRDFLRLVMAQDLPSESRLYSSFDRKENVRPIPLGARKITSVVLSRKTGNPRHALLFGNDPGTAKAGTVFLDAYDIRGEVWWWVRGELFTLHETTEQHAVKTLDICRKQFGVNVRPDAEIAHGRAQPVGQSEDKPDLDLYRIYKRVGLDVRAAQYKKDGTGTGHIKKESRIGMVNMLFCDASGRRRLYIECDDRGVPVAPQLVAALETMERDDKGRAEHEEKNVRHDKSDLPAALGYALHAFEKESALALRAEIRKGLG